MIIHYVMVALTWAIGVFGVTGAIAAVVACVYLGPQVVLAILQPLLARFIACTKCVVMVTLIMATIAAYWLGHHQAVKDCRAEQLQAELHNQQIDLDNARKAKIDETERANSIEANANDQHDRDLDYIKSLQTRPGCALDDSDLGRMPARSRFRRAKPAAVAK